MVSYYVKNAKWFGISGNTQYSAYPTLDQARSSAIRLLDLPYYDAECTIIYVRKGGRYVYHSAVRRSMGEYEGPNEDVPMDHRVKFVYRSSRDIEYPCRMDGSIVSAKHWRAWFDIECIQY